MVEISFPSYPDKYSGRLYPNDVALIYVGVAAITGELILRRSDQVIYYWENPIPKSRPFSRYEEVSSRWAIDTVGEGRPIFGDVFVVGGVLRNLGTSLEFFYTLQTGFELVCSSTGDKGEKSEERTFESPSTSGLRIFSREIVGVKGGLSIFTNRYVGPVKNHKESSRVEIPRVGWDKKRVRTMKLI